VYPYSKGSFVFLNTLIISLSCGFKALLRYEHFDGAPTLTKDFNELLLKLFLLLALRVLLGSKGGSSKGDFPGTLISNVVEIVNSVVFLL